MKKTLFLSAVFMLTMGYNSLAQEGYPPPDSIDTMRHFELLSQKILAESLAMAPEEDSALRARIAKLHGRWHNFWQSRVCLDAPDSVSIFSAAAMGAMYDFEEPYLVEPGDGFVFDPPIYVKYPTACLVNAGGDWKFLGPKYNAFNQRSDKTGRVSSLWVSPTDTNYILAGSSMGGLFKTTNGGATWANITDSFTHLAMGTVGIGDIAVHPGSQNIIWLNTGIYNVTMTYGMTDVNKYNTGFLFSTDGGITWKEDRAFKTKTQLIDAGSFLTHKIYKLAFSPFSNKLFTTYKNKVLVRQSAITHTSSHTIWDTFSPPVLSSLDPDYKFTDFEFTTGNPGKVVFSTNNINGIQYLFIYDETSQTWTHKAINTSSDFLNIAHPEMGILDLALNNSDSAYMSIRGYIDSNVTRYRLYRTDLSPSGSTVTVNANIGEWAGRLVISPANPATIYLTNHNGHNPFLHRSDNYGNTFTDGMGANTHADGRALILYQAGAAAQGADDIIFAGTDGGVAKKSPWDNAFRSLSGLGLDISQSYGVHSSPTYDGLVMTGTLDNGTHGLIKHIPGNFKWREISWNDGTLGGFARNGVLRGYSQTQSSFARNAGFSLNDTTFSNDNTANPIDGHHNKWMRPVKFGRNNTARTGWWFIWRNQAPTLNTMDWTTAFGDQFLPILIPNEPKPSIGIDSIDKKISHKHTNDFIVADNNPNIAYIAYGRATWWGGSTYIQDSINTYADTGINGKLFMTLNGGAKWFNQTPPRIQNLHITDIDIDQKAPNRIWASYGNISWGQHNLSPGNRERRVYYSESYGDPGTWVDISKGLPYVPVNKILYVQGSDNVVFAATDIGVYRWNDAAQQWECFNNGLPRGMANDLEMHYCSGKLRVAIFGRGIYETDWKPNQNSLSDKAGFSHEIDNNTTWSSDMDIDASIHIAPGKTLTIDGATIYMARNARILVDAGAKLELKNGAKLTNGCTGCVWQGIELVGNIAAGQSNPSVRG